jgi:hypothetical protein
MDSVLNLLKLDLGVSHNLRDTYFLQLLQGSVKELEKKGIRLNINAADDSMLLADYAAWIYRKRQEDVPLANNIQHRIRNRIIKERVNKQNGFPEV